MDRRLVGRIELQGRAATVEVPDGWKARLVAALDGAALDGRRVRVSGGGGATEPRGEGDHFVRLAGLLELESKAEAQKAYEEARKLTGPEAERRGNCLLGLVVQDEYAGLGGRYLLTLVKRDRGPLPWTRLNAGTPVLLPDQAGKDGGAGRAGVVCDREGAACCASRSTTRPRTGARVGAYRVDAVNDEAARLRRAARLWTAPAPPRRTAWPSCAPSCSARPPRSFSPRNSVECSTRV